MGKKDSGQLLREEHWIPYDLEANIRAALVFPNSYYLGMSSLGFQVMLDQINRHPDISCERVFFQGSSDFGRNSYAMPQTIETSRPLSEFDMIGFSVSFELDYINVVRILHAAKIPLRSEDRGSRDPLVIAGGICSTANPEPISSFIDAFVIGDGEEVIHNIISEYQNWRVTQDYRRNLLHRLSGLENVYVPLLHNVVYKVDGVLSEVYPEEGIKSRIESARVAKLDEYDTASKILTPNTEFANTFLVEVTRGCAHRCKFCLASYVQKCRIRSRDAVLRLARSDLAQRADKIGLLGSSVADHPQIDEIAASIVNTGKSITIASIRADLVGNILLDALAASGQKTLTLAPEAASDRLRKVIGKDMPLEAIFEVVRSALKRGITNVKLYFMVGLPTETYDDVASIATLAKNVKHFMLDCIRPRVSSLPRLIISVSPFVPKPHTPFQWCQMDYTETLSNKLQILRRKFSKIGGIRTPSSSARWSAIQGMLARGDRRLVNVLQDIAQKSLSWNQALKKNGLNQDFYLQRPRQIDEVFPWDHISTGVSRVNLERQYLAIAG